MNVAGMAALVTGLSIRHPRGNVAGIPDHQRNMNQLPVQRSPMSSQVVLPERFAMV